jgi:alpha-beta hydrolase superfamily lysophospholipase
MGCVLGTLGRRCIFPAPGGPGHAQDLEQFGIEQGSNLVWLATARGDECPALYIRPSLPATLTVLVSHGNAEDLSQTWRKYEGLAAEHRVAFFLYEYSGYGLSRGGGPSEAAFYSNIEAAFQHLVHACKVPRAQIILWGRSIGSGPTVHLASREKGLGGMMLESGLASACRTQGWPGACCACLCCCGACDFFNNQSKLAKVDCATLLMHGTADKIVRCESQMHLAPHFFALLFAQLPGPSLSTPSPYSRSRY